MQPSGNTILITGGGSGIGRALAASFHALGNQVIIAARRRAVLDAATAAHPGIAALTLDIEDPVAIRAFAAEVSTKFPALNVLINNAGIMRPENLQTQSLELEDAEATVLTNLLGPIRLTAALLPQLKRQPHAAIMNVSSGLAFIPWAATPTYCATKAAIHSYSQSLRYQLRHSAVQVLELIPPYVQTELMGAAQAADPHAMPLKAFIEESLRIITEQPQVTEICVERVKALRFAEAGGNYAAFFQQFNQTLDASAH